MLTFEWDSRQLAVFRGKTVDQALTRALRLAGNQAIRVTQRESATYIISRKFIRESDAKKALPIFLPKRSTDISDLVWEMRTAAAPVPVAKFPHIDTRHVGGRGVGVLARINVGKGASQIAHAFDAAVSTGHQGVFMRKGKARYPIVQLVSSRVGDPLRDAGAADGALAKGYKKLEQAWAKGLERELGKLKSKGIL